ncbi:acetyl-CoA acetyltransferase [Rhodococcus sp. WMMA185]|uniref:acetyl-CoA acetyltransferase n=1 Tax=Rhodococcus sp. WMMA185 TaxID=679318 RepID=UPI000878E37C|nr:acetyl-CoA acetyltransferase [Rhodococcus sp. WMMA185]AOW93844.1 acetyl-CoA acetyltransferase [Rhodococcus sp. WMMA185]
MPQNMIHVLGGYQSDFAVNWHRAELGFDALFSEAIDGVLGSSGLGLGDIEVIHVGNAFGELFTGQSQLGAMPATVAPTLVGVPSSRHEAACASGSMAVLGAMTDLESGRYDCALVIGAELEKTVSGDIGARTLGAAAWVGHEAGDVDYVWPHMFASLADEYDRRYGLDDTYLRAIGELNFGNARTNPLAQTRGWSLTPESFADDDQHNPPVSGRLRRQDCSQMTDGASAVVLVSERLLERRPDLRARPMATITGWGHRTAGLPLAQKLRASADDVYVLPHVRQTVADALGRAGLAGIEQIDGAEVHDCFSMTEYMIIDHLGITPPGESWKAIEGGDIERGRRIPVNPSGGLMGVGHPVGASGVRMLFDGYKQVTEQADGYQVPGARRFITLNIGGSATTVASFVVESSPATN